MAYIYCKRCNNLMRDNAGDLCHKCKKESQNCIIGEFGYKKLMWAGTDGIFTAVPWCFRDDERIIFSKGGCGECENRVKGA